MASHQKSNQWPKKNLQGFPASTAAPINVAVLMESSFGHPCQDRASPAWRFDLGRALRVTHIGHTNMSTTSSLAHPQSQRVKNPARRARVVLSIDKGFASAGIGHAGLRVRQYPRAYWSA